ncbi:MAG: TolC family protein [Acidobacteria bacterium]|nr:TolC family protein [Acidobacteriota bacterium]
MYKRILRLMPAVLMVLFFSARGEAEPAGAGAMQPRPSPLRLSLKQAVDLALAPEGNARIQLAEALVRQTEARRMQSRAALLPSLESSLLEQNQTRNLAAFGIRIAAPIPGFQFPEVVGPFTVFDARLTLSQSLLDFSSIRRYQASHLAVGAARTESESARDAITGLVSRLYATALRAHAGVDAVQANVKLAEALLKLARDQKDAGTGTAIEVTRAQVQLFNERQRLLVAETERRQAHLQLARAIGLDLEATIELSDVLGYDPVEAVTAEEALAVALQSRSDLKAQRQREETARLAYSAVRMERLPSLAGFADYGSIGSGINNASPTRTFGLLLRIPLFDGGRRDARRVENLTQVEQEQIKTRDLEQQIGLEIRVALESLRSAAEQIKVAQEGMDLSQQELAQARRRYEAGMTSSLEVTDAQTRLERASDNRIAALFGYSLARISLGEAMGTIRSLIR